MKRILIAAILLAGCFQACQKEEILEKAPENNPQVALEDEQWDIPEIDIDRSALIIDGTPYYAGIGYSPTQDRLFAPAIDAFDMFQSNDIPQPLKVEVEVIRTNEELERYVRKTVTRRTGGLFAKIFGFGRKSRRVIEDIIEISESNITVIARISVQSARYLVDGDPFLNDRAQDLIDQGRLGDFIRRHGPGYVDSQVIGGDVYYVYNYDLNKVSIEKKTNFERNIEDNIKYFFGLPGGRVLSNNDKRDITNAVERYTVESNIIGFTPNLINSRSQINGEIQRIQNYLAQNPTNAAAMEMSVASYANIASYAGFTTEYNNAIKCYQDWEGWSELQAEMVFVFENTTVSSTRQQAQNALNNINAQLVKSRDCNGSVTPNLNQYNGILNTYTAERRRIDINAARKNISVKLAHYPCGPEVPISILAYQYPGTVPFYKLASISGNATTYHTTYDASQQYVVETMGYVFPQEDEGTVPLSVQVFILPGQGNIPVCVFYNTLPEQQYPGQRIFIANVFPPK